jgi:hypothetical protein
VAVASIDVVSQGEASFYGPLLGTLKTMPGVVSAAVAWSAPLGTNTGE